MQTAGGKPFYWLFGYGNNPQANLFRSPNPKAACRAKAIEHDLAGFTFSLKRSALAAGQFGSGWGWLSADKSGKLVLSSSQNQDNPLMEGGGLTPILGIDVWEHAYYLHYKNLRAEYIKAFFNVVDWAAVGANYDALLAG